MLRPATTVTEVISPWKSDSEMRCNDTDHWRLNQLSRTVIPITVMCSGSIGGIRKKFGSTEEGCVKFGEIMSHLESGNAFFRFALAELKGNVPTVQYYDKYFGKGRWKSSTVVQSLSIGQGELGITPLQMANTMCIIANNGYFTSRTLSKRLIIHWIPDKRFTEKNYTDIEPKYYAIVQQGMESVVESGTAAGSKIKGITVW